MKVEARVARGKNLGKRLLPHRHADGAYVVSPTRFKVDYIRVGTIEEAVAYVRQGLSLRMSNPADGISAPSLIAPDSIVII